MYAKLSLWTVALGLAFASPSWAQDAAPSQESLQKKVERLEALVRMQGEQITGLERQLQTADQSSVRAQDVAKLKAMIREIMQDPEFRKQMVASTLTAGYDKGFYIKSADEDFKMVIQLMTQFRYIGANRQTDDPNVLGRQKRDDLNGFQWNRTRMIFQGNAFSPRLQYYLQTEGTTRQENVVQVLDLYWAYEFAKGHKIWWGQAKVPQGYEVFSSDDVSSFVDRSFVSGVFDLDRTIGVAAMGDVPLGKDITFHYLAGIYNGTNNLADDVRDLDTNFAVATREELEFGKYDKGRADLRKDGSFAALLGTHFVFNDDNNDRAGASDLFAIPEIVRAGRGGYGAVDATGTDLYQFGVDAGIKYRGLSLAAEYWLRHVENDFQRSAWYLATVDRADTYQGGMVQAGYLIPKTKLEPVVRAGGVWGLDENVWEYAAGMNYYIKGHSLKISGDVTVCDDAPVTSAARNITINDDITLYRLQIQAATK